MGQDREDGQGGAAEVVPTQPSRIVTPANAPWASSDQTDESESPTPDPPHDQSPSADSPSAGSPREDLPPDVPAREEPALEPDQAQRLFHQRRKPQPRTYEEFLVQRRHLRELAEARREERRILRWELTAVAIVVVVVIIRQLWLQ